MSLSRAVDWWEEWQLRILVLGSLAIQLFLAVVAPFRKWSGILKLYRLAVWLSYLGGDALAIYALATLFNRQKKLQYSSSASSLNGDGRDLELEVLWAPILLMHLGGRMTISAYNIEDNELWLRHVGVAISQVTVTVYVFWTTWSPSADKRLFAAAVLLFVLGAVRCFEKPLALRRASFSNLVTCFSAEDREINTNREVELEQYIQDARDIITTVQSSKNNHQQQQDQDPGVPTRKAHMEKLSMPDMLFVDYAFKYSVRLHKLRALWLLDPETAFKAVRGGLSKTFNLIYTKLWRHGFEKRGILTPTMCVDYLSIILLYITMTFPIASIVLFHMSHKEAYRGSDVKVTYLLLYITYFSEIISVPVRLALLKAYTILLGYLGLPFFPFVEVEQHNLIQVLVDKRRCPMCCCQDFFEQRWFGRRHLNWKGKEITSLVIAHAEDAWMNLIEDIESYWKLSDSRGHWTLERNGCQEPGILRDSLEKPLDESVILWHLATDLCFRSKGTSADPKPAILCTKISNYMMYLLCANTDMLLPGSRTSLFKVACKELDGIFTRRDPGAFEHLTEKIISKAAISEKGVLHDAWLLAQALMQLPPGGGADDAEENQMWKVIQGVWVEMLCYSARRCRGFLHAKNLAYGGEFLTYVALLMSNAGLETFADRQQRMHLHLSKEERLQRAKRTTEQDKGDQDAGAIDVIKEGNTGTPSTASASAQGECTTAPALEVVVIEAV